MKTCTKCGLEKESVEFSNNSRAKDGKKSQCKSCDSKLYRLYSARVKEIVFTNYGNACACCGETEPLFLAIDHINNDGAEHRKELGGTKTNNITGRKFYCKVILLEFPSYLQLLCHNCNQAKHLNKGVCPHVASRCNPRAIFT